MKITLGRLVTILVATLALFFIAFTVSHASDVQWSRLKGTVKGVNYKASTLTLQDRDGDLVTVKVDDDVRIMAGKELRALKDVTLDDKVTLVNAPQAPKAKDADEPPPGGVYK